ncbi:MAG: hypothetical protein CM1200mP36_03280 [Gammaproteobacteria bacterium]|nr:MAG: hypothetical protein CM1200mP36_03280 [Gammaproteobacteria bacterium]
MKFAIGGLRIVESNLAKRLWGSSLGDGGGGGFSGDELMEFSVMLVEGDRNTCVLETVKKPKNRCSRKAKGLVGIVGLTASPR